jgi:hypothetical protein
MVFQALLFSLTSYRFYSTLKAGWGDVPLISIIMRDGTWAFILLFRTCNLCLLHFLEFSQVPSDLRWLYYTHYSAS